MPRDDAREFKKFVPIKTVVRSVSISFFRRATVLAFFCFSSSIRRILSRFKERKAVSEDVKKATQKMRIARTIQNLEIVKVDAENNLIAIKGAIPGPRGGIVVVSDSVKA